MKIADTSSAMGDGIRCRGEAEACDDLDARLARSWLRIGIAAVFAGQGMVFSLAMNITPPDYASLAYWVIHGGLVLSTVLVMAFLGGPLFRSTFSMLRTRRLSIEGLFTLSLGGAFVGSLVSSLTGQGGVFYEVIAIVIAIYTVGRMLSERSQASLTLESERLREDFNYALVLDEVGEAVSMPISELTEGTRVRVLPGAAFTVDGIVLSGIGYVRESALTGEPAAVVRRAGDRVRAGTWSEDGAFEVEASAVEGGRELDRILDTVEKAGLRPSEMQSQANDLIQGFLPLVVGASAATAIYWSFMGTWAEAVLNSMAVLLVACPCALGLATPVAIWQGLLHLARIGIVSRDGALIDGLARTRQVFFDKTGTLSEQSMVVSELLVLEAWRRRRKELIDGVLAAEESLKHPAAEAVAAHCRAMGAEASSLVALRTIPGAGVDAEVEFSGSDRQIIRVGEASLCPAAGASVAAARAQLREQGGKAIFAFVDEALAAVFVLRERAREGVESLWEALQAQGVGVTVLTGDPNPQLSFPECVEVFAGLSAEQKRVKVAAAREQGLFPLFVGDGVNDASALGEAAASIAMSSGTGLARAAASGEFTADRLEVLPHAIRLARAIRRKLKGNLIYAVSYNILGMGFAAAGYLHPVIAAVLMLVSSFLVTARVLSLNSGTREQSSASGR